MNGVWFRLTGLCLPPLLLCALDGGLTLAGQSSEYWGGDYAAVNEASPTFHHLLQTHPLAFACGIAVWGAIFASTILLLPDTAALIVSIAVTFGHAAGAATWLLFRFQYGYQLCNALFLLSAVLVGLGIRFGWRAAPAQTYQFTGTKSAARWIAVALLFGVGIYLFVWPRSP